MWSQKYAIYWLSGYEHCAAAAVSINHLAVGLVAAPVPRAHTARLHGQKSPSPQQDNPLKLLPHNPEPHKAQWRVATPEHIMMLYGQPSHTAVTHPSAAAPAAAAGADHFN
jgi:hypothetical protein